MESPKALRLGRTSLNELSLTEIGAGAQPPQYHAANVTRVVIFDAAMLMIATKTLCARQGLSRLSMRNRSPTDIPVILSIANYCFLVRFRFGFTGAQRSRSVPHLHGWSQLIPQSR